MFDVIVLHLSRPYINIVHTDGDSGFPGHSEASSVYRTQLPTADSNNSLA